MCPICRNLLRVAATSLLCLLASCATVHPEARLAAQTRQGMRYLEGAGAPAQYQKAVKLFARAAAHGYAPAENDLGLMYVHGHGVPRDAARAAFLFRRAAARGSYAADRNLGLLYLYGQGVPVSYGTASRFFAIAAGHGYGPSSSLLCALKSKEDIFAKSYNNAIEEYERRDGSGAVFPRVKDGFPLPCGFYPQVSQLLGEQGTALVKLCIRTNGSLLHKPVLVKSTGSPRLDAAALRYAAATSGYWIAPRRKGVPVRTCQRMPVRFALMQPVRSADRFVLAESVVSATSGR